MPLRYWRTSACVLALGIGGLAVCAEECIRGGAPAAKETKQVKADSKTEPALAVATPLTGSTPPLVLPEPKDSAGPMIVVPMLSPQGVVPASFDPPPVPKPADPSPAIPVAADKPAGLDLPPPPPTIAPKSEPLPAPLSVALPPAPPPAPMIPKFDPPPVPMAVTPPPSTPLPTPAVTPPPSNAPPAVAAKAASATKPAAPVGQYKLYLRMGGAGQPRFEIRDGDQLLLKVTCEQIELHGAQDGKSALPGLTASGNVKLHGSGLDGTCDQLSITAVKGEVALKGAVKLTCYRGTMSSQVVADSVMFQLTRTGETAATKVKGVGSMGVVPASVR